MSAPRTYELVYIVTPDATEEQVAAIHTQVEQTTAKMGGTLTFPQLIAIANFARTVPQGQVAMHVLPSHPGRVYVYPDRDAARALVSQLFPADRDARLFSDNSASRRSRRRVSLLSLASR